MRVLVVTAVEAEKKAIVQGLETASQKQKDTLHGKQGDSKGNVSIKTMAGGVGIAAAAASTAIELAESDRSGHPYDLVVAAGIGGGFYGRVDTIGDSVVLADEIIAADLGAETPAGFQSIETLGLGPAKIQSGKLYTRSLLERLRRAGIPAQTGPILTVSTVTGTAATAGLLAARYPGAAAEGMEGFGVACAAGKFHVPVMEIRAISNWVGPRNRSAWRMQEALQTLTAVARYLKEVLT